MTASCGLERTGDGEFLLHGDLGFETVSTLLSCDDELFSGSGRVTVDLAGVTEVDSAGLALLLRWLAAARRLNRDISFRNVPETLKSLAMISDLEDLICA